MRVLLVNQSSGHLFNPIAAELLGRGHRVTLLAGSLGGPVLAEGEGANGRFTWRRGTVYRRQPAAARLLTWGLFSLQLAWLLLRQGRRFDRVLLVSNPPTTAVLARWLLPRYALLLYDLYPQVLRDLGVLAATGPLYRLLNGAMAAAVTRADLVVVLSEAMAAEVRRGCRAAGLPAPAAQRLRVEPPWADTRLFRPLPAGTANPRVSLINPNGGWVILYGGNLGLTHPLEPLLAAVARLAPALQLVLVADGPRRRPLQQRWGEHPAVRFLPLEPPADHALSLQAASLAAVCLEPEASAASVPSKTFAALACGTPLLVIAARGSTLVQLVEEHGCGLWAEPDDGEGLVAQLAALMAEPARLAELRARALAASANFSHARAAGLVDQLLAG